MRGASEAGEGVNDGPGVIICDLTIRCYLVCLLKKASI